MSPAASHGTPGPSAPALVLDSTSAEHTRGIGTRLGGLLRSGDVVLLGGDLGAGKTTMTQGIARALGIKEQVTSPTFTLLHAYDSQPGEPRLLHADLYRLDHLQEVIDLGLPELIDDGTVVVIEWGEQAVPVLLPDYLEVRIEFGDADDARRLLLRAVGARWTARVAELRRTLGEAEGRA